MQCGGFIRTSTMILNLVFLITGIFLISFGAYSLRQDVGLLHSTSLGAGVIVLGVLIFLVSFFGCWGATRESRRMLIIYIVIVLIIVLIEIILGIVAYAKKDSIPEIADSSWTKLYNSDTGAILDIESTFKCCGWFNDSDRAVPPHGPTDLRSCVDTFPEFKGSACGRFPVAADKSWGKLFEFDQDLVQQIEATYKCCGWHNASDRSATPSETCSEYNGASCGQNSKTGAASWYSLSTAAPSETLAIEYGLQCCGWMNDTDHAVPPRNPTDLNTCVTTFPQFQGVSCRQGITDTMEASLVAAGGCAIGIGVIQIVCLLFSCYLLAKIPKKKEGTDTDVFLDRN